MALKLNISRIYSSRTYRKLATNANLQRNNHSIVLISNAAENIYFYLSIYKLKNPPFEDYAESITKEHYQIFSDN